MNKIVVSILASVYLLASTGTSVDIHYCMDKLVAWSFSHEESKACGSCGMEKKDTGNGCCKDEQKFVKTTIDQKWSGIEFQFLNVHSSASSLGSYYIEHLPGSLIQEFPCTNAPPDDGEPPAYLLNCVFRI